MSAPASRGVLAMRYCDEHDRHCVQLRRSGAWVCPDCQMSTLTSLLKEIQELRGQNRALKQSQGYSPPPYEDDCLEMAGNPEV